MIKTIKRGLAFSKKVLFFLAIVITPAWGVKTWRGRLDRIENAKSQGKMEEYREEYLKEYIRLWNKADKGAISEKVKQRAEAVKKLCETELDRRIREKGTIIERNWREIKNNLEDNPGKYSVIELRRKIAYSIEIIKSKSIEGKSIEDNEEKIVKEVKTLCQKALDDMIETEGTTTEKYWQDKADDLAKDKKHKKYTEQKLQTQINSCGNAIRIDNISEKKKASIEAVKTLCQTELDYRRAKKEKSTEKELCEIWQDKADDLAKDKKHKKYTKQELKELVDQCTNRIKGTTISPERKKIVLKIKNLCHAKIKQMKAEKKEKELCEIWQDKADDLAKDKKHKKYTIEKLEKQIDCCAHAIRRTTISPERKKIVLKIKNLCHAKIKQMKAEKKEKTYKLKKPTYVSLWKKGVEKPGTSDEQKRLLDQRIAIYEAEQRSRAAQGKNNPQKNNLENIESVGSSKEDSVSSDSSSDDSAEFVRCKKDRKSQCKRECKKAAKNQNKIEKLQKKGESGAKKQSPNIAKNDKEYRLDPSKKSCDPSRDMCPKTNKQPLGVVTFTGRNLGSGAQQAQKQENQKAHLPNVPVNVPVNAVDRASSSSSDDANSVLWNLLLTRGVAPKAGPVIMSSVVNVIKPQVKRAACTFIPPVHDTKMNDLRCVRGEDAQDREGDVKQAGFPTNPQEHQEGGDLIHSVLQHANQVPAPAIKSNENVYPLYPYPYADSRENAWSVYGGNDGNGGQYVYWVDDLEDRQWPTQDFQPKQEFTDFLGMHPETGRASSRPRNHRKESSWDEAFPEH